MHGDIIEFSVSFVKINRFYEGVLNSNQKESAETIGRSVLTDGNYPGSSTRTKNPLHHRPPPGDSWICRLKKQLLLISQSF